jgi:hypothetical protein
LAIKVFKERVPLYLLAVLRAAASFRAPNPKNRGWGAEIEAQIFIFVFLPGARQSSQGR